jgi:hypothetical protein
MNEELFESAGAKARVKHLAPGLMHFTFEGHVDDGVFDFVHKAAHPELAAGGITMFFDTMGLTGFTTSFRLRMVHWQKQTKGRQFQVVLLRSRVVAFAIGTANKMLGGGVVVTADPAAFERLLTEAVVSRSPSVGSSEVKSRLPRL